MHPPPPDSAMPDGEVGGGWWLDSGGSDRRPVPDSETADSKLRGMSNPGAAGPVPASLRWAVPFCFGFFHKDSLLSMCREGVEWNGSLGA